MNKKGNETEHEGRFLKRYYWNDEHNDSNNYYYKLKKI